MSRSLVGTIVACGLTLAGLVACDQSAPETRGADAIVRLDDLTLGPTDFARLRSREQRVPTGAFSGEPNRAREVDLRTLAAMEDAAILSLFAREQGITVSDEVLRRNLESDPAFHDAAGRFDLGRLSAIAKALYGTAEAMREARRADLVRMEAVRNRLADVSVSEAEARRVAERQLETIEIGFVVLDERRPPADFEVANRDVIRLLRDESEALRRLYEEGRRRARGDSPGSSAANVTGPASRGFEAARRGIARELLAKRAAKTWVKERASALERLLGEGVALEAAAKRVGLAFRSSSPFPRPPDGYLPGLGHAPAAAKLIFNVSAVPWTFDQALVLDGRHVFLEVRARHRPAPATVATRAKAIRPRLLAEKQNREIQAWLDARREALRREGRLRIDADALDRLLAAGDGRRPEG